MVEMKDDWMDVPKDDLTAERWVLKTVAKKVETTVANLAELMV